MLVHVIQDKMTTSGSEALEIAASLAVIIFHVVTIVTDISISRQTKPCVVMICFMTAVHPKGIHVTPDPSLCNSKQEVSSQTNGKHHPISKGLTLRSDLLGNVQGTAHITCDIVSTASRYGGSATLTSPSL